MRRAARRDEAEKGIVDALKACGCDVTFVSGEGAPDLLVRKGSRLWAFEVKGKTGKRTKAQQGSQWPIVRTVEEALAVIGANAQ